MKHHLNVTKINGAGVEPVDVITSAHTAKIYPLQENEQGFKTESEAICFLKP